MEENLFGTSPGIAPIGCGSKPMVIFGVGAPPILVYFSGDWDGGSGVLTHGQKSTRKRFLSCGFHLFLVVSEYSLNMLQVWVQRFATSKPLSRNKALCWSSASVLLQCKPCTRPELDG